MSFWEMVNDPNGSLGWIVIGCVIGFFAMIYWIIDCIADVQMAKWEALAKSNIHDFDAFMAKSSKPDDCAIGRDSLGDNGIGEVNGK